MVGRSLPRSGSRSIQWPSSARRAAGRPSYVVNPKAVVSPKRRGPEAHDEQTARVVVQTKRVGKAPRADVLERLSLRHAEEHLALPACRLVDVDGFGRDVEVSAQQDVVALRVPLVEVSTKALQPIELEGVFVGADRLAVRDVDVHDPDVAIARGDDPRLAGLLEVREADANLGDGLARDDGDAVVGRLAIDRRCVPGPQRLGRESVGNALDLLQAEDIGLDGLEPLEDEREGAPRSS